MSSLEKPHHLIEIQHSNPPSDPKQFKKWMSLQRKQIKTAKEERFILASQEVVREAIRGGSEIASNLLQALGQWQRGIAQNPDPIAQGVAIAEEVVIFGAFLATFPKLAEFFGINRLLNLKGAKEPNFPAIISQAKADAQTIIHQGLIVPPWLTQLGNWDGKSLNGLPDVTGPMQAYGTPDLAFKFRQDLLTMVTGGGSDGVMADLHQLALDYITFALANPIYQSPHGF